MPTNLHIDDALLDQAMKLGGFKTKKDTVNAALQEFVDLKKRRELIAALGTVDFDPAYDYKAERRRAQDKLDRLLGQLEGEARPATPADKPKHARAPRRPRR